MPRLLATEATVTAHDESLAPRPNRTQMVLHRAETQAASLQIAFKPRPQVCGAKTSFLVVPRHPLHLKVLQPPQDVSEIEHLEVVVL